MGLGFRFPISEDGTGFPVLHVWRWDWVFGSPSLKMGLGFWFPISEDGTGFLVFCYCAQFFQHPQMHAKLSTRKKITSPLSQLSPISLPLQNYDSMIKLVDKIEGHEEAQKPTVQVQCAFALNRRNKKGDRDRALSILEKVHYTYIHTCTAFISLLWTL